MSRFISLVLAGLLAAFLVGAPAQAAPRSTDPEVVAPTARPVARSAERAPASIDSDVHSYAPTPNGTIFFVVAGHLRLTLASGSTTRYSGSLVDYVGNKSSRASADASDAAAPVLKLEGKNGKLAFRLDQYFGTAFYNGKALSKPAKLKVSLSTIVFSASAHVTKTASYSIVLSERSGGIHKPIEYAGTLTIAYDANGRVSGGQVTVTNAKGKNVTHALKSSGFYGSTSFYTVAQVDKLYFGLTATITGTFISGYGFAADGARTSQWALSGRA